MNDIVLLVYYLLNSRNLNTDITPVEHFSFVKPFGHRVKLQTPRGCHSWCCSLQPCGARSLHGVSQVSQKSCTVNSVCKVFIKCFIRVEWVFTCSGVHLVLH